MGRSRFIELMAKSIDKSASKEELEELEVFLKQYPRYNQVQKVTSALKGELNNPNVVLNETEINSRIAKLWNKIKSSETVSQELTTGNAVIKTIGYKKWLGAAAAVAVLGVLSFLFFNNYNQADQQQANAVTRTVDVPFGKMMQVTLSDGTTVKLNAGSHFTYPSVFSAASREVTLDGEGFFEVTKNHKKPFLVHTDGLTVRVLGTVFNVKAYHNDKKTETTLLKGKVQVELADDPEKMIILSPNEKLTVANDRTPVAAPQNGAGEQVKVKYQVATLPVVSNGAYEENAWTENKMMFTNSDFEDVAHQMERKYNVHIIFEDEALKREQISGVFKDESLDMALNILKQTTSFKSRISGSNVYLGYTNKHN
ncbi:MAG TPA: FecR domain-containing protein [Mucilaginibacter sp.]